jgi:hypothetical protein
VRRSGSTFHQCGAVTSVCWQRKTPPARAGLYPLDSGHRVPGQVMEWWWVGWDGASAACPDRDKAGQKAVQVKQQATTGLSALLSRCPTSREKYIYIERAAASGTTTTAFFSIWVCSRKKRDKRDKRDKPSDSLLSRCTTSDGTAGQAGQISRKRAERTRPGCFGSCL